MKKLLSAILISLLVPSFAFAISVSWEKLVAGGIHPFGSDKVLIGATSTTTNRTFEVVGNGYFSSSLDIGTTTRIGLFQVSTNTTIGLVVDTLGNVGIGTTTPDSPLHITGVAQQLHLQRTVSGGSVYQTFGTTASNAYIGIESSSGGAIVSGSLGSALVLGSSSSKATQFFTGNLIRMTIDTAGNVGIGTTTPLYLLDVYGNARLGTSTASSLFFRGLSNFNDLFFIDTSGNASTTGEWKGAKFTPEKLSYSNATTDEYFLTYETTGNTFEWVVSPGGVTGTSTAGLTISGVNIGLDLTTSTAGITITSANQLGLALATSTARISITNNNQLGIEKLGTEFLVYSNATTDEQYLTYEATGNAFEWTTLPAGFTYDPQWITSGTNLYASSTFLSVSVGTTTSSGVFYVATGTSMFVIDKNGQVGIGTTGPSGKLGVAGVNGEFYISSSWSEPYLKYGANNIWRTTYDGTAGVMDLYAANAIKVELHANGASYFMGGNVGIGTTTPLSAIDVEGNINIASGNAYKISDVDAVTAASTTAWNIAYDRASSTRMAFTITDATTTPSDKNPLILPSIERAMTITKITCIADPLGTTGDQITIDIWEADSTGQATSSVDATIVCDANGATDDGSLSNSLIDAGDFMYIHFKTASGSVESLAVSIYKY